MPICMAENSVSNEKFVKIWENDKNGQCVTAFSWSVTCDDPLYHNEVHPHFYAAYCRDPDGHKLLVVCHEDLPDAAAFSR